jgi:hypothetical protein
MNNYLKNKRGILNDLNLCYIIADACCFLNQKKWNFFFASLNLTNFFVIVGRQIAKFSISQKLKKETLCPPTSCGVKICTNEKINTFL